MVSLKKLLNGRGTWLQRTLLGLLGVVNVAVGAGLVLSKLGRLTFAFDPFVVVHFAAFAQASGAVILLLFAALMGLSDYYSPEGRRAVKTHRWVYARTGEKVRDASVKEVYERKHGKGSWNRKVERERRILTGVGVVIALALTVAGVAYLVSQLRVQILTQISSLLGHGGLVAGAWLLLALIGVAALPAAALAFWDTDVAPWLEDLGGKYEYPPEITVVPRKALAVGVVLLHVVIFIASFFPAVKAIIAGVFPGVLIALSFGSAAFWLIGAVVPDPGFTDSYGRQIARETAAEVAQNAVKTLFGENATREERYAAAWILLMEPDVVTAQGKRQVVEALKVLCGRDFGDDHRAWMQWLQEQLR